MIKKLRSKIIYKGEMMRKRVLTYSLAVAMAVAMAVPQTVILSTGIVQVKAANTETGLKTGIAITKAEWEKKLVRKKKNYIKFTEMDKSASTSSDYCSKINKVCSERQGISSL